MLLNKELNNVLGTRNEHRDKQMDELIKEKHGGDIYLFNRQIYTKVL